MGNGPNEALTEIDEIPLVVLVKALKSVGYEISINPVTKCLRITRIRKVVRRKSGDGAKDRSKS